MIKKYCRKLFILLLPILFLTMAPTISGNAETEEKRVKIGYYDNETFQEGASEGAVKSGYCYEYLQKIASLNGWRYEYVYGSWTELYDAFVKGEVDLLAGLGYSESRLDVMYYPDYPMGYESYYMFIRSDDSSITLDPQSLRGKKIGAIPGLMEKAAVEWLEERGVTAEIVLYDDVSKRDKALENGDVDAFIGEGASVAANGINRPLVKICNVDMYLCVAKNRYDLLIDLNAALAELDSVEPYYIYELSQKYFSKNAVSVSIAASEIAWLEDHDYIIKVGYMDDFLPYCGTDENGNATGIMVDILKSAFSNLHLPKEIKFEYYPYKNTNEMIEATHKHDIEMMFPISNNIYYLEQNDLYHSKDVITSAMNFVYKGEVEEAKKLPLAINRNNQIQYDYAKTHFPETIIIEFESVEECLNAVANGAAGGAILSGLRASTLLKSTIKYELLNYIELPYSTVKCFGVSTMHKGILPLVNQALNTLDEEEAMTYTYKYIDNKADYSVREFIRQHTVLVIIGILIIITVVLATLAVAIVKHQRQKIYYSFAYKDSLTKLYNRRSYEEDLEKYRTNVPDNLLCVSMDLNGLKNVNDNLGHSAGDELIREAGRIVEEAFGKYGRVYRTGGDEYYGILRTTLEAYEQGKAEIEKKCEEWKGEYSDKMRISLGCAGKSDIEGDVNVMEICKIADKRMYEAKSAYYRANNIDRRRG